MFPAFEDEPPEGLQGGNEIVNWNNGGLSLNLWLVIILYFLRLLAWRILFNLNFFGDVSNWNRFRRHTRICDREVSLRMGSHIGAGVSFEYTVKLWKYPILSGWKGCGVEIQIGKYEIRVLYLYR